MYKAIIFDLDGTLADTLESIAYTANYALQAVGFEPHPVDRFRYFAGDGAAELLRRSLLEAGDKELENFNKIQEIYREFALRDNNFLYRVTPYSGIMETLSQIKASGLKTAVLSNKPDAGTKQVVTAVFEGFVFDFVQGQKDGIPKKPSPEGALRIAEEFSALPEECIYVGDTNTDMLTGKKSGMYTVGVTWGFRSRAELEENGADLIIEKPEELLCVIKQG